MAGQQAKKTAKGRKIGSNKDYCKFYASNGCEIRNKRRKLRRHLRAKRHTNDLQGLKVYLAIGGTQDAIRT
jgi:hypothetical protein